MGNFQVTPCTLHFSSINFQANLSDAAAAVRAVRSRSGPLPENSKYYFSKLVSRAAIAASHVKWRAPRSRPVALLSQQMGASGVNRERREASHAAGRSPARTPGPRRLLSSIPGALFENKMRRTISLAEREKKIARTISARLRFFFFFFFFWCAISC